MNIDQLLREAGPDPDALHDHTVGRRADVLSRATAGRRRRTRRPVRLAIAGATTAILGLGGVAYAAGTVPALVTSVVDGFGSDAEVAPADRPEMVQIVDLGLPDGSRFAAWAGSNARMWCTVYGDNWDGSTTGSGGAGCGDEASDYDLNRDQLVWAQDSAGTTHYPVLFGAAFDDETSVRVTGTLAGTGRAVDLVVPIDPATSAYAAVLPGTADNPWSYLQDSEPIRESGVKLEFLDARGAVLRTVDDLYA